MIDTDSNTLIYYYEDKPYRILHEGKLKITGVIIKCFKILEPNEEINKELLKKGDEDFAEKNNGSKWIDVVIYEPLYEECDIRICVKEKEDFYNNYKPKI